MYLHRLNTLYLCINKMYVKMGLGSPILQGTGKRSVLTLDSL